MIAEAKSSQLNLRLTPALKAAAEKAAAREHRSLTSLIEKLLADHLRSRVSLEAWHRQSQGRLDDLLLERAPTLIGSKKYRALSFVIHTADGQELEPQDLLQIVRSLPNKMQGVFYSQSLFYVDTRNQVAPYYTSDPTDSRIADATEILESALFPDIPPHIVDFWRITPRGFASHIRTYNEDREDLRKEEREPGKWFWPYSLVRDLYALVLHAYFLSERFEKPESVEFRCEWWGLRDRELADADPLVHWMPGKIAKMDHRVTTGDWAKEDLRLLTPDVVSALAGPILRLFDPSFDCSPRWVGDQTQRFRVSS